MWCKGNHSTIMREKLFPTLNIGKKFVYCGERYVVVESNEGCCDGCAFIKDCDNKGDGWKTHGECTDTYREDKKKAHFELVKTTKVYEVVMDFSSYAEHHVSILRGFFNLEDAIAFANEEFNKLINDESVWEYNAYRDIINNVEDCDYVLEEDKDNGNFSISKNMDYNEKHTDIYVIDSDIE